MVAKAKASSTKKTAGAKPETKKPVAKAPAAKKPVKSQSKALAVGDVAPNFKLSTDGDGDVSLSDFRGKKTVIVYFYPKDNTPGCTRQACAFQAAGKKISKSGAVVIGISPDSIKSHAKFREKFGLEFILAADEDHKVAEQWGVWTLKKNYGKEYMGIQRSTFIVDKKGIISHVWAKVSVDGHDTEILEALGS